MSISQQISKYKILKLYTEAASFQNHKTSPLYSTHKVHSLNIVGLQSVT